MTRIFLFGCHFCRNTHNAAKTRLPEAATLVDIMGLYNPMSYQLILPEERDCWIRTLALLTVIEPYVNPVLPIVVLYVGDS